MKPVRLLALARQELRDAAEYYERQSAGLGFEFTRKVDSAVLDVRENPESWPLASSRVRRRPNYWIGRT